MGTLGMVADERVAEVGIGEDVLTVSLMDGRTISRPLAWYPRSLNATEAQRRNCEISGGGYGIHWPEIDEEISTDGLLRGAPPPRQTVPVEPPEKGAKESAPKKKKTPRKSGRNK